MVNLSETRDDPLQQLWDEIEDVHAGMLGIEGSHMHMQPMAPFIEKETGSIWFYTRRDSDLVRHLSGVDRAHFCVVGKDHDYHACLSGVLAENKSQSHIDKYWSSIVAAWFHGGKDDPQLTMIQLKLDDAAIWASSSSTLKFGWEMAKANLDDDHEPDVGVHTHINFAENRTVM
ncbi:pyridoxamine 5'-phosphate oxidase family protein [Limoniibacter endophyticus]|uniref:General stress protein n=1 Tax=Limoniibacter endophyticus TaxID=1565040 RepID=A0A8J3DK50_9HYPH|nr:pyridoxamine 5'-phosphate oxidase family protein [Limoniibacter endophyticus]GHC63792.1 general stress protein [Limoniibacter endophyticus]